MLLDSACVGGEGGEGRRCYEAASYASRSRTCMLLDSACVCGGGRSCYEAASYASRSRASMLLDSACVCGGGEKLL